MSNDNKINYSFKMIWKSVKKNSNNLDSLDDPEIGYIYQLYTFQRRHRKKKYHREVYKYYQLFI